MSRKTDIRRDSHPKSPELYRDPNEKAQLEARNGLLQFDEVARLISEVETKALFKLKPSTLSALHRIAIQDIYSCAGNYRTHSVEIRGTDHQPPPWQDVSRLAEEMCDYVMDNWSTHSPVHLSAYIMWRLNWIHPFSGGNGRTSRATSYLVLCAKLGYRLPGTLSVPEQIVAHRDPYYAALDAADHAWASGLVDVSEMEALISTLLAAQLLGIHRAASGS